VLASDRALPAASGASPLSDVVEQLGEMTTLISELIELARVEQQASEPEEVRLDLLVADVVERARRNQLGVSTRPISGDRRARCTVDDRRAVANLLDNAAVVTSGAEVDVEVATVG
jgi:signal transduction histidine kinase